MTDEAQPELPEGYVDRQEYLESVDIDSRTLTRWIKEAVVEPEWFVRGNRRIHMFSSRDVTLGRQIIALHRKWPGRLQLADLVAVAKGEKEFPEHHNPAKRLRPTD